MSVECAWLIGGTRWLGAGRKLAHRGRADDQLAPPAKRAGCSSSNRAAGDSQPPAHRLGTTQDPAGDAPAEGRVARRVNHALIDRLIQFLGTGRRPSRRRKPLFTATCVTNGAAINRRRTVGPKVCTHGVHPAPRGLASSLTRAPESRRSVLGRKAKP